MVLANIKKSSQLKYRFWFLLHGDRNPISLRQTMIQNIISNMLSNHLKWCTIAKLQVLNSYNRVENNIYVSQRMASCKDIAADKYKCVHGHNWMSRFWNHISTNISKKFTHCIGSASHNTYTHHKNMRTYLSTIYRYMHIFPTHHTFMQRIHNHYFCLFVMCTCFCTSSWGTNYWVHFYC